MAWNFIIIILSPKTEWESIPNTDTEQKGVAEHEMVR